MILEKRFCGNLRLKREIVAKHAACMKVFNIFAIIITPRLHLLILA